MEVPTLDEPDVATLEPRPPEVRIIAGLAADDYGSSDSRHPLVLLHGLTFNRGLWRPILAELGRVDPGRRVLAFDLPGHGASPAWSSYDVDSVAERIHQAAEEAHLGPPVVVGHSIAAAIATRYAARYPTSGVVNIDQPLQIGPFAHMVRALAEQLRGPDFSSIWQTFVASMHIERLPKDAQDLVRSSSHATQSVVLGYWREVLQRPVEELEALITEGLAAVRVASIPYLFVGGEELHPVYREWMTTMLPNATITVWSDSGHFPHLAHPRRFAACLARTESWSTSSAG
jgi:pimeloyl-ACP methyl ester carboxylesterase